ncbi:MAG: hypothetical protein HGB28_04830 [Oscillochloris sp.]|nr:hypothetical protein [Oscillochloris sp.]
MTDSPQILSPPSPAALRADLERLVILDLLGPVGGPEEEIAEGGVRDRYLVGMLAPRQQQVAPEQQDDINTSLVRTAASCLRRGLCRPELGSLCSSSR